MFSQKSLFGVFGIILAFGMVVIAQQPLPQTPETAPDGTVRRDETQRLGETVSE